MVRRKGRTAKYVAAVPEDNPKISPLKPETADKIKNKPSKGAKTISSEKKSQTRSATSKMQLTSEAPNSSSNSERKDQPILNSSKKRKSHPMQVYLQNHRNVTAMSRALYKEIRRLQRTTNLLFPKATFGRVVREIMSDYGAFRVQSTALMALQEACEIYLTQFYEDAYFCTLHAKRKTLQIADMNCARRLRGLQDVVNR